MLVLASVALICYDSFMIKPSSQRRLNIFIDETGEFGFGGKSAKYYGVSLVLHEHSNSIEKEIIELEKKFREINFDDMFHMGDLLYAHKAFKEISMEDRERIFFVMYSFARKINVKYHSIIFEKSFSNDVNVLRDKIGKTLAHFINNHSDYLRNFSDIVVYYDSGQKKLASAIDSSFSSLSNYRRNSHFDHYEKKLFQVADMMTFVDKLIFKYDNGIKLTETENKFFRPQDIRSVKKGLTKKHFEKRPKIRKAPFRVL